MPAEKTIATIRIEVKTNKGFIVLPGKSPILLDENPEGETFTVPDEVKLYDGTISRIGRDKSNDIVLDVPSVSRFHALFSATSSDVTLSDLSSTNGTMINGVPVSTPVQVSDGDVVEIGPSKLMVEVCSDNVQQTISHDETTMEMISRSAVVTILVVDVCGYTHLTEALPIKDVMNMLHHWSGHVSKIIQKAGGEIDKYIGDCVMAFWHGSTDNAEITANKAANVSMEILKVTQELSNSSTWPYNDKYPWGCRVSLNTGEVMIGAIGTHGSRDFSVWGDVVNIAFRLNTKGSELGHTFVISESTADFIKNSFDLKNLGPVKVKGREKEVVIYTLA